MCSIGEDDFGDDGGLHAMVPELNVLPDHDLEGVCSKCGCKGASCKLKFREVECRDCFLNYVRHKFRAVLGSSKILPRDAKVLAIFDGSGESIVLLDMLHHAHTQSNYKRLHCSVRILYVDEGLLLHPQANIKEHIEHIRDVHKFLSQYIHFESSIVSIGYTHQNQTLFNFNDIDSYLNRDMELETAFIEKVMTMRSLTSRQDYIRYQRSNIISSIAEQLNCGFAFLPDITSTIAAQLLSAIVLGRGGSAALDVSLVDDRLGSGTKLIRPMKDLNEEEVQLYLNVQQIQAFHNPRPKVLEDPAASLQNLSKAFVNNLQQNFSATVSTVSRTGDKIAANHDLEAHMAAASVNNSDAVKNHLLSCVFCNSPLDFQESPTLLAIEFSRLVSEAGTTLDKCSNMESAALSNLRGESDKKFSHLCHACRNMRNDCSLKALLLD